MDEEGNDIQYAPPEEYDEYDNYGDDYNGYPYEEDMEDE